ncbi:lytic murein transglycosylase B [Azoarcus sp. KH32C]|uniref:lytic murein transglycosylase B n=1 Tax=Azoarcus sp. KH32C TaxID=748247 RepID=UPI0002386653|nr:lytic murein transglycosylase B [Azoarcus sp. KH32C]BAL25812.1 membrane-bound lytic transglycosylase [Azoarcus sp. KH32C]
MKSAITAALLVLALLAQPSQAGASYAQRDEGMAFAKEMQEKHGFDQAQILAALDRAHFDARVIRLIKPPATPTARSWQRYRARFLESARINSGIAFWHENEATLQAASDRYGVPPEIVAAIIGVETYYGRNAGNFELVSALATLAFDYPPRASLFQRELENLFLLAREQGRDPFSYYGSYAGALGYPQFLPSSIRNFAVDFDGDGHIDIDQNPTDAIGSVANYLSSHGWVRGEPVASPALVAPTTDTQPLINAGIEPTITPEQLAAAGITPVRDQTGAPATLVDLATPGEGIEYWLGYRNFYVITRYNKSSFYAMAVFQLAQALRDNFVPGSQPAGN